VKTIAFSVTYQAPLQKVISGPAIQVKFGKEILSFIVYFVCKSRFHSQPWNLLYPTAETRVGCFTKERPFISEVKHVYDSLQ